MPTPVFPTAYKVEALGSLFGVPLENVWYCQGADPFDLGDATAIAAAFQIGYADILTNLSQDVTYNQIVVTNLGGVSSGQYSLDITPPDAGSRTQDSLPGSVAFCVSLKSALAGRRFRGRKYFSGLGEEDVFQNGLDSGVAGGIVAAINDLITALAGGGTPLSIFSATGLTLVPVVNAVATDLRVDSQRGRLK